MASFNVYEDVPTDENDCNKVKGRGRRKVNHKKKMEPELSTRNPLQTLNNTETTANFKKPKLSGLPQSSKENDLSQTCENNVNLSNAILNVCEVKPAAATKKLNQNRDLLSINSVEKEYEKDIFSYLLAIEKSFCKINPNYMSKQQHIDWRMRSILIGWLVSVAEEYDMSEQTLHLSVNYLDRFLSKFSVTRARFQLVGATAMAIAGKVEEIYPPTMAEWSYLTADAFTVGQFLKMEQFMLKTLNFQIHSPTMLDFIKHLCAKMKFDTITTNLAMYLSELVLLAGKDYLRHVPSKLASTSIVLARHTLSKRVPWTKELGNFAGYSLEQLSPVVARQQQTFVKSSSSIKYQAIRQKYSTDKYKSVALLKAIELNDEEDKE